MRNEIAELKAKNVRLLRLLDLKDDAFAKMYEWVMDNQQSIPNTVKDAVSLGFSLDEVDAAKARQEASDE